MLYALSSLVIYLMIILSIAATNGTGTSSVDGDNFVSCGDSTCQKIFESFNKENLPHGYLQITTIPENALNISLKQVGLTDNHLVLKGADDDHFIINGESGISPSGVYKYDNASFEYLHANFNESSNDDDVESVYTAGPIHKALDVMILVKDRNPGITLEYFLPIQTEESSTEEPEYDESYDIQDWNELNTPQDFIKSPVKSNEIQEISHAPTRKRRKPTYMWKIKEFSPCSRTCGEGIQTPVFECVRDFATRVVRDRRCAHLEKPVFNENIYKCNLQSCPAYWHTDHWQECNCIHAEGFQIRDVRCVEKMPSGLVTEVTNTSCASRKPEEVRKCDCWTGRKKVTPKRRPYDYPRGSLIGTTHQRKVISNHSAGIWLASDWYTNCSTLCGSGYEYRSIFCERTFPRIDRCNPKMIPDTARVCKLDAGCDQGEWGITDWSDCTGDCFNLERRRRVFCVKSDSIVEDAECDLSRKPATAKKCSPDDVDYCKPRWYYSEWSICSKTCGGGMQRRSVRCLEFDRNGNVLHESKKCSYADRQPIYSSCNTKKCPETMVDIHTPDITGNLMQCNNAFANCAIINKAKFCKLAYYQRHCCQTCKDYI